MVHLRLSWAVVLSMAQIVQILNWVTWPELFLVPFTYYIWCIEGHGLRSASGDRILSKIDVYRMTIKISPQDQECNQGSGTCSPLHSSGCQVQFNNVREISVIRILMYTIITVQYSIRGASQIKLKKVNKKRTVRVRRVIIFLNISRHPLLIWLHCCFHQYKTPKAVATAKAAIVLLTPARNLNKVFWGFLVVFPLLCWNISEGDMTPKNWFQNLWEALICR